MQSLLDDLIGVERKIPISVSEAHYKIKAISAKKATLYMRINHYTHTCVPIQVASYGLYEEQSLIGAIVFALPVSESVRISVFGEEYKNRVTELVRLHLLDLTPTNTESWFVSRCLKLLKKDHPELWAVISFSDTTMNHFGTVYQSCNFYKVGTSEERVSYVDNEGRLRHKRQGAKTLTDADAVALGWKPEKRMKKIRYLYLLPDSKKHKKELLKLCKFDLGGK